MSVFVIRIQKSTGPTLLFETIFMHWNCSCRRLPRMARVTWIGTWKTGPIFSIFNSALAKIINKLLWLVLPGKIYFISSKLYRGIRELKQRRRRRQQGRQKSNGVRLAKEKLCTCITLFYSFLCCRCMTTMWNCLIWRFVEDVNTRQWPSFSFSEL